ncbi:MAG: 1-(5-phosphoribosyl)-5-[(5-phosphoribosylamino)methylideneamino]imidazole-4-carboxamide isomerase [Bacteroidales bacterium]
MNIKIIPAIDLIEGKCVRLTQGDYLKKTVYQKDPVDMAKYFSDLGIRRLHLVDLDGAKANEPKNLRVLERIATSTMLEIEFGGGIKSTDALNSVFSAGASYAIGGSIAVKNSELFISWLEQFKNKIILGADIKDNKIAINGWMDATDATINELIQKFIPHGLKQVICTEISRDGMLEGPDFELYKILQIEFPKVDIIVSGGVSSNKDIETLEALDMRAVIVGKAIYENKVDLKALLC